jgi:hypothetical protein
MKSYVAPFFVGLVFALGTVHGQAASLSSATDNGTGCWNVDDRLPRAVDGISTGADSVWQNRNAFYPLIPAGHRHNDALFSANRAQILVNDRSDWNAGKASRELEGTPVETATVTPKETRAFLDGRNDRSARSGSDRGREHHLVGMNTKFM